MLRSSKRGASPPVNTTPRFGISWVKDAQVPSISAAAPPNPPRSSASSVLRPMWFVWRKGMGLRGPPLRLGQTRRPFRHRTHAHLDSWGNAPTEVLALVHDIHGDACADIDDQPSVMRCGVGKTVVKHGPGIRHAVQSQSFGCRHVCGQGGGVPWTQDHGFRERRSPRIQVATASHHDLVFRADRISPSGGGRTSEAAALCTTTGEVEGAAWASKQAHLARVLPTSRIQCFTTKPAFP